MAYRNKFYACFDGDNDIQYYRLLTAWSANENHEFNLYDAHALSQARDSSSEETIKRSLRERLKNSKALIVIVGKNTRNLFKFVRWEMEVALDYDMPIIVVNINNKRRLDDALCPPIIRDELAIHISFEQKIIWHAMNNWPSSHAKYRIQGEKGDYYYSDSVYQSLGL